MNITLTPEQEQIVLSFVKEQAGLSVEDVITQALHSLSSALPPSLSESELESVLRSIEDKWDEPVVDGQVVRERWTKPLTLNEN